MKSFLEIYFKRPIKRFFHIAQSQTESLKLKSPSKNLKIIAVTGTSGKSSTSSMIFHVLKNNGIKAGVISTIEAVAGEKTMDTGLHVTTPDAKNLQRLLAQMRDEGIEYVVLETSSHSIAQGRLGFLKFDYAVFTNIKKDHLDWHGNWQNYAKAKAGLINRLRSTGKVIVNKDDTKSYDYLRHYYYAFAKDPLNFIEYSKNSEVKEAVQTNLGLDFEYKKTHYHIPVLGEYNIENALAAIRVAELLGIKNKEIAASLATFKGIKGRMEIIQSEPFMVIVDFAHNADSIEKALKSVKNINGVNRIISVFGSAGLRDVEKRFNMGEAAAKYSDIVIATAEDPRTERLFDINNRIIAGAESEEFKLIKRFATHEDYIEYISNLDTSEIESKTIFAFDQETVDSRFDAIDLAIRIAKKGDVVITEGKGHEQSLCFGTTEYPFTDQMAVEKSLNS